jgi:hypothetical protein
VKKIVILLAAALAFSSVPALAQTAALNADTTVAAKELMDVMNARAMMRASMQQMSQQMPQMLRAMMGPVMEGKGKQLTAEQKKALEVKLEQSIPGMVGAMQKVFGDPKLSEELERETTAIYARNFSADEMRQMVAFYRSPVGAKMLATMPKLMQESMVASQKIIVPRMGKLIEEMTAGMAK